MNKIKNYIVLTWIQRTWPLILAQFFFNWLALTEHHFVFLGKWVFDENHGGIWVSQTPMEFGGPVFWYLPLGFAAYLLTSLCNHMRYRQTIDADIHSGKYLEDWKSLEPYSRVYIATLVFLGVFIGLCILGSGLVKG